MIKRVASVLITGRFIESTSSYIVELKDHINQVLHNRSTIAIRWRALLGRSHFSFADLLLTSGFEIIPVEVEDMELAMIAAMELSENRFDEMVFGFGDHESEQLLRRLTGRVTRTLLTFGTPDNVMCCDEFIDCSEIVQTPQVQEESDVAFDLAADEWKDALVRYVSESDGVCPAARAFDHLKTDYPALSTLYRLDEASLRDAIPKTLRWIVQNKVPMLYSADHPSLRPVPASEVLARLTFGGKSQPNVDVEEPEPTSPPHQSPETFNDLAKEAAIFAEESIWCRDRILLVNLGASYQDVLQPRDTELEEKASEYSLSLWMKQKSFTPDQWKSLEESYRTLERAARLMQQTLDDQVSKTATKKVATILARSICLLKSTIRTLGFEFYIDMVQNDAYELAIAFAKKNCIRLPYLCWEDTCDLIEVAEINATIEAISDEVKAQVTASKMMRKIKKQVKYHLDTIARNPPGQESDWNKVVTGITTLCDEFRVPTSNATLRSLLSEYIAKIPEEIEITSTFANVIQQIDQFEEQQAESFITETVKKVPKDTENVKKVRQVYGSSTVVWVGGNPDAHLKQRIENRFDVKLSWEEYDHGDSISRFASVLNNPDVKLFLVYIPWCSHKHSEELAQIAKAAGKDFVRLPKGTNPDQIASAICMQTKG